MSSAPTVAIIKMELQKPQGTYALAKAQAKLIDDLLGFNCDSIEEKLFQENQESLFSSPRQFWYGLELQSLQTPYSEIHEMIQHLNPKEGERWLDLGAAYGRMGIALGFLRPTVHFIGYEYDQQRVDEGNRLFKQWNLLFSEMKQADLAVDEFQMPVADLYFVYDFGSKEDIYKVLEKLRLIAAQKQICIVARGRGVRNWILMDFPWLYDIHPPEHFKNWTVFRS